MTPAWRAAGAALQLAVPQREPLSAPLLGSLFAVAGLFAGWLMLAVEAVAQLGAARLAGFDAARIALAPPFAVPALHLGAGEQGPWAWAAALLAGPLLAMIAGLAVHLGAEALQAAAWLRVVAFEAFAFAWLRLPLLMLSAGVRGGRGTLSLLYEHLGEPESGRWAAIALGLVFLWGIAALVAWRAVTLGREWLRADGRGFRRRAVRLLAGYPFVLATAAYLVDRPTGPLGWLVVILLLVLGALFLRTT